MKYSQILLVLYLFLAFFTTSCFKNTDLDQVDALVIRPIVELDLIYFDIDATQFYDGTTDTPNLIVRDTTALELIASSDARDGLIGAEFLFKFTNSIPRDFIVNFDFLSENNELQYASGTIVSAGSSTDPMQTIYIDNLNNEEIDIVTLSNKVAITVTIPAADASLFGNLNLQSKTTYFLEIN
jgi:hypothetical protein